MMAVIPANPRQLVRRFEDRAYDRMDQANATIFSAYKTVGLVIGLIVLFLSAVMPLVDSYHRLKLEIDSKTVDACETHRMSASCSFPSMEPPATQAFCQRQKSICEQNRFWATLRVVFTEYNIDTIISTVLINKTTISLGVLTVALYIGWSMVTRMVGPMLPYDKR